MEVPKGTASAFYSAAGQGRQFRAAPDCVAFLPLPVACIVGII